MKNNIKKKFKKINSLVKTMGNNSFLIDVITNDFILIYFHLERILWNRKYVGNIYSSIDKMLSNLLVKINDIKSLTSFLDHKIVKLEKKKIHSNHMYVFQNLWSKYNREEFVKNRLNKYIQRVKINNLKPLIKNKTVMDYGCGHGQFLMAIKKLGASKCLGIDFGRKNINYAKNISKFLKVSDGLSFKIGDVSTYKVKKNYYDFAIQNGVFHHIDTQKRELAAYKNVYKSLKKGSFFWVYTQGGGGLYQLISNNFYEILKKFDKKKIISIIFSKNITINKKYVLSDNFTTKYRFNSWSKLKNDLTKIGFTFVRPLKGGEITDFDKDFTKDKQFKAKFGEGQIRALFLKKV